VPVPHKKVRPYYDRKSYFFSFVQSASLQITQQILTTISFYFNIFLIIIIINITTITLTAELGRRTRKKA